MGKMWQLVFIVLATFLLSKPAMAYIGPGMGGGALAVIIGFFAAIFLAFMGIIYYPIRRFFRRRKLKKKNSEMGSPYDGE
jgi:O-antigen/teichoic acid export membrane protein